MFHAKQIERHAIAAYVQYGVRLSVPLSAGARKELARIKRSVAGLRELEVARTMHREMFETAADFHLRLLAARSAVHAQQVAAESVR